MMALRLALALECIVAVMRAYAAEARTTVILLCAAVIGLAILEPAARSPWAYLPVSTLALAAFLVGLGTLAMLDWIRPHLEPSVRWHLRIAALWFAFQVAAAVAYDWYVTASQWRIARWWSFAAFSTVAGLYLLETFAHRRNERGHLA